MEPCVDCKWRLRILQAKPVVIIFCQRCRKWFVSDDVCYIDENIIRASAKGTGEHVNDLLRCDAMASHIIVTRTNTCGVCNFTTPDVHADPGPHGRLDHVIEDIITRQIANPWSDIYERSALPAYTLQRRCGAHPHLQELYLKLFPEKKSKVLKYQEQRKREQDRFQNRDSGSVAKRGHDRGTDHQSHLAQLGLPILPGGDNRED